MNATQRGYFYAFLAPIVGLPFYIFSKLSFSYFNLVTTMTLWFGFSALFSFGMIVISKKIRHYKTFKTHWKWIILATIFNSGSVATSFYAIQIIGPSLVGFLGKISMLMIVLTGIVFLDERFSWKEVVGGFLVTLGVFMISFSKGEFILLGVLVMVAQGIFVTASRSIIKKKLYSIDPLLIVNYRATCLGIYFLIFGFFTGTLHITITTGLWYATIPSIFSVIFYHLYTFKAYKLIEMSKVALIGAISPFLVVILAFFVFGDVLTTLQIGGGTILMIGVITLVKTRKRKETLTL